MCHSPVCHKNGGWGGCHDVLQEVMGILLPPPIPEKPHEGGVVELYPGQRPDLPWVRLTTSPQPKAKPHYERFRPKRKKN